MRFIHSVVCKTGALTGVSLLSHPEIFACFRCVGSCDKHPLSFLTHSLCVSELFPSFFIVLSPGFSRYDSKSHWQFICHSQPCRGHGMLFTVTPCFTSSVLNSLISTQAHLFYSDAPRSSRAIVWQGQNYRRKPIWCCCMNNRRTDCSTQYK